MTAPGPDVHLLAELDAGLLDEDRAREVRAAAEADPAARAVLAGLAATRAELAALPDPPVPPALAARWLAAIEAERSAPHPGEPHLDARAPADTQAHPTDRAHLDAAHLNTAHPDAGAAARADARARVHPDRPADRDEQAQSGDLALPPHQDPRAQPGSEGPPAAVERSRLEAGRPDADHVTSGRPDTGRRDLSRPARKRRRAGILRRPAVLAGVLLVAVVATGTFLRGRTEPPPPVDRAQLVAQALSAVGTHEVGGLDDPVRRAGCLLAAAAPATAADEPLLGGRQVTFEGHPGVLLVLGTGRRGTFDIMVVDPACGPGGGTLLTSTRVGQ